MGGPPPLHRKLAPGAAIDQGRYKLVRQIGAGGNGEVWLAEHGEMETDVVIKFPKESRFQDDHQRIQFETEIRSLSRFSSRQPHIVNILDVGRYHDRPFVVMQYMSRGSLARYCQGDCETEMGQDCPLYESATWLVMIADALGYVHDHGLVHRDVKPANILIDDSYSAYLADFGIAVLAQETTSHSELVGAGTYEGAITGSLPYVAAEVLSGEPPSAASDQFSLAVTTYEFIAGERPFRAKHAQEMLEAQQQMKVAPLNEICSDLPIGVWQVIRRALLPQPQQRFDTCQQFAREVAHHWKSHIPRPPRRLGKKTLPVPPLPVDTAHHSEATTTVKPLPDAKDIIPSNAPANSSEEQPVKNQQAGKAESKRIIRLSRLMPEEGES